MTLNYGCKLTITKESPNYIWLQPFLLTKVFHNLASTWLRPTYKIIYGQSQNFILLYYFDQDSKNRTKRNHFCTIS